MPLADAMSLFRRRFALTACLGSLGWLLAGAAAAQPDSASPDSFGDRHFGVFSDPSTGYFGDAAVGSFDSAGVRTPPPGTRPMGRVYPGPVPTPPYISLPEPVPEKPATASPEPAAKKKPAGKRAS